MNFLTGGPIYRPKTLFPAVWKKYGQFLKWRLPAAVLIIVIFRLLIASLLTNLRTRPESILAALNEAHVQVPKLQTIKLRIEPPDGTFIGAACFLHNTREGIDEPIIPYQNFTAKSTQVEWKVNPSHAHAHAQVYFCDSLHGQIGHPPTLSTKDFPVYGDFVPQKSSLWLVDFRGRRRIEEDGRDASDYVGRWYPYPADD